MAQFREKFPTNYSLLLAGPPGVGKFEYLLDLARDFLAIGEKVLFVTVDLPPQEIRERASARGLKLTDYEAKSFLFIDCYSQAIMENAATTPERGVIPVSSFSNLEGVGMAITKGARELKPPVRILFYTISTLFLHNTPQTLAKFFQIISSRVKGEMGFILYALHDGVHDERTMALLSSLVDGVLEMRFADAMRREIRIHHMRGHPVNPLWVHFEIEPQGAAPEVEG